MWVLVRPELVLWLWGNVAAFSTREALAFVSTTSTLGLCHSSLLPPVVCHGAGVPAMQPGSIAQNSVLAPGLTGPLVLFLYFVVDFFFSVDILVN